MNSLLISALLLAQSFAITPRRRARVDVPKASKLKKELAATKKQNSVAATEDVGFAHRYFSTAIDVTPLIEPTVRAAEGWLATLVLGAVNAGHIWFFAGVFTMFPAALKRLAVVGVGTAYPVAATMVAASTGDTVAEDKWLTY